MSVLNCHDRDVSFELSRSRHQAYLKPLTDFLTCKDFNLKSTAEPTGTGIGRLIEYRSYEIRLSFFRNSFRKKKFVRSNIAQL